MPAINFAVLEKLISNLTLNSTEQFNKKIIEDAFGKDSEDGHFVSIMCFYEFLYFYIHMMNRAAGKYLDKSKNDALFKKMFPLQLDLAFNSFFKGNDKNQKRQFEQAYNNAETMYAQCTEFMIKDKPISKNALLSMLSYRIADIFEHNKSGYKTTNPSAIPLLINVAVMSIVVSELAEKGSQKTLDYLVQNLE